MCGILVAVRHASRLDQLETVIGDSVLRTCIRRRGPDHLGEAHTGPHETGLQVHFLSSVLHLRSNKLVEQPFLCRNGSILGWNGELYRGIDGAEEAERSDTALVADALESTTDSSQILECFSRLEGEFAFAFYHAPTATLWFGRDRFGRRSLVWRRNAEGLELSSVACRGKDFQEVPTMGLFSLELGAAGSRLSYHRWHADSSGSPPIPDALEGPPVGLAVPTFLNLTGHNLDVPSPVDGGLDALLRARIQIVADFEKVLGPSVRRRVCNVQRTANEQASIAILFSGGLDCTVLAYLAGKAAPDGETIDLLNVAFENPRSLAAKAANKNANPERDKYNVPDRDTARRSVLNLRQALPDREFRLVEINVPFEETKQYRDRILDLMFPSATVMDLSIAMAFWFAVRGESDGFVSRAKVLLSGLGADELLGGYSRHRARYYEGGWPALEDELKLDIGRLPSRNLGRDDRIVADHGKEVRLPFLDEEVVEFCARIPVYQKCDPRLEQGTGDKVLLRLLAHKLGLRDTANFKKRAIQFGARTAKMELGSSGAKGDDVIE